MTELDDLIKNGKNFLESGDFERALSFFDQALLIDQNDAELWNFKGVSLRSLGRYNEAIDCFNKSLEIDPRDKAAS